MGEVNTIVNFVSALFVLVLLIECIAEYVITRNAPTGYRKLSIDFILLLGLDVILQTSSGMMWFLRKPGFQISQPVLWLCEWIVQCSYYGIMVLFLHYVSQFMHMRHVEIPGKLFVSVSIICCLSAVFWCSSSINGLLFRIEGARNIVKGKFYWLGQLGGYVFFVSILWIVMANRKVLTFRERLVLTAPVLLPCMASVLRMFSNRAYLMPLSMTLSVLIYYSFVHVEQTFLAKEQEGLLANYRIKLMLSQIRPHFLFNTLNSIYFLCEKDPEKAQIAIGEFSEYLRGNFEGLENQTIIPFSREMEHVRHYLSLEKLRFGKLLHVIYDLDGSDFSIPPLTLQPLAENAVKHGIVRKKEGGVIHISSRETEHEHVVRIADTGVGFDPKKLVLNDDRPHIGLKNVRERLWLISQGTLEISSSPGKGTVVIVRIPKERHDINIKKIKKEVEMD